MENTSKTVGLNLAKDTFHVFCADAERNGVLSKALWRNQVLSFFEALGAPCLVAVEKCTGANWWCRRKQDLEYDARLIPAAYVKPYVKRQTNDALENAKNQDVASQSGSHKYENAFLETTCD